MRLVDAYRRGILTYGQYTQILEDGHNPTDKYSTEYVPIPTPENTWTEILDWDTEGLNAKNIAIENLDSNYDLDCKIEIYIDDIVIRTENQTISDVYSLYVLEPCTSIVVNVRSAQYGYAASYDFAYTNDYS